MNLSISTRQQGDHVVVELGGELDMDDAEALHRQLIDQLEEGDRGAILELSALTFLDSTGLSALIRAREHAHSLGKALFLTQPQPTVAKVFSITGMNIVFDIVDTPEGAAASGPTSTG